MKVLKVRIQMLSNLYLLDVLWDLRAVARVVHPLSLFRGFWQTLLIAIHHLCYEWQQPCTQSRAQFADASVCQKSCFNENTHGNMEVYHVFREMLGFLN